MDKNEKTVETTVFDYLRWRGDLTFAQDAFNEVDNLILCIIAYLNFRRFPELTARDPEKAVLLGNIVPRMTAEDEQQGLSPNDYIPLMRLAADSRRFGGVRMLGYEAVRVLAEGMTNRVICVRDDQIVNVDIDEGLAMKKTLNAEEFEVMTVMTGV